jgi:large subunit ribosomal protein L21e
MKASKGPRRRTRKVLSKRPRKRGLSPITHEFQDFEVGERVNIVLDSSIHRGMPHPRFHGKTGTVVGNQGTAFVVKVRDGNKLKTVVSRPEHLRRSG